MAKELICEICGHNKAVKFRTKYGKLLCWKHNKQLNEYNRIVDITKPNTPLTNEITYYDSYAEIILYNSDGVEKARTKVDLEDLNKIKHVRWYMEGTGYARSIKLGKLHRFLMKNQITKELFYVDHINLDKLDNRRDNLRVCRKIDNEYNHSIRSDNTSGCTGVYWRKHDKTWEARIYYNKKEIRLGIFQCKGEAVKARKEAEEKYFGEFAYNPDLQTSPEEQEEIS